MTDPEHAIRILRDHDNYSKAGTPVPTFKLAYAAGEGLAMLIERQEQENKRLSQDVEKTYVLKQGDKQ